MNEIPSIKDGEDETEFCSACLKDVSELPDGTMKCPHCGNCLRCGE
jgi:hypothetical protein